MMRRRSREFVRCAAAFLLLAGASCLADDYDAAIDRAKALIASGRFADARAEGLRAVKTNESRWEGYVLIGTAYAKQNLCDDAIGYFQMSLGRAPEEKKELIRAAISECRKVLAGANSAAPAPASPPPQPAPQAPPQAAPAAPQRSAAPAPAQLSSPPAPATSNSFRVFHSHRFNWGPAVLTLGPTVTFRETLAGPFTTDNSMVYDKDSFSVPLQQVRFSYKTIKGFQWDDTGDGRTWEQHSGKSYSGEVLVIEAAGKKWEFYAPNDVVHAIGDALRKLQSN